MKIVSDLESSKIPAGGVCAIGNFDGVHLGHQFILKKLMEVAENLKAPSLVLTFHPHPFKVLYQEKEVKLICTREQKNKIISNSGIDFLVEIPFDLNFSKISAREFIEKILVEKLKVKGIVVGLNFTFGNRKEGTAGLLKRERKKYGFFVEVVKPFKKNNLAISSTNIRKSLIEGKIENANEMLGR
ncbi:MAG: adenylyltransferase/cytidyltransferase family protein, partial [Thermoanaerobaculia bacterium]